MIKAFFEQVKETALQLLMEDGDNRPHSDYCTRSHCGSYFRLHR